MTWSHKGILEGMNVRFLLLGLFMGLLVVPAAAQEKTEDFEVDLISTWSEDPTNSGSRLDVYTRIPFSNLSFINSATGFTAGYEVKLDVREIEDENRLGNLVQSRIWDSNVVVNTYGDTQLTNRYDFATQSIGLDPGRYMFELAVSDRNSSQTMVREMQHEVKAFNGSASISDIMLLESYDQEKDTVAPRVDSRIGTEEAGFQMFYEVYSSNSRPIVVTQEVRRLRQDPSLAAMSGNAASDGEGEIVFSKEETSELPARRSQYIVTIPLTDQKVGSFEVEVTLSSLSGQVIDSSSRTFWLTWSGLEQHIENIDVAISQLEYVAKKRDMNFILDAPNEVERYRRFRSFWEKRDPTPGTQRNEAMEEYYYRISAANENYGTSSGNGWKTDRGLVLVRYGEPDHIRYSPYSFDSEPYEIWLYERIGRQFIFVDKSGFGDFELLIPVWDEGTRL